MSILKTGLVAASLVIAASVAHADSSVPVQGAPVLWQNGNGQISSDARSAFASAQRTTKTWNQTRSSAPFTRDVTERMSGH